MSLAPRCLHVRTHSYTNLRSSDLLRFNDRKLFGGEKLTRVRRARILCEHEIFDPRPVYSWPLTPEDDESGNELDDPETRSMGAMLADARHRDALADWRKRMRERVQADGNWTLELDTPAQLNEAMDAIGHYFACLVSIGQIGSSHV